MKCDKIKLRYYQQEAIRNWTNNDYKGIISMATGTGKTITALEAVHSFVEEGKIILVVVPTNAILRQWHEVISNCFPKSIIIVCYSGNFKWKEQIDRLSRLYSREVKEGEVRGKFILSTMATAWKGLFKDAIRSFPEDDMVIIIDEVHHVGARSYRNILELPIKKRLGLSATPNRIYNYTLSDAILDGCLSPYKYYIEPVSLTIKEAREYIELSIKIKKILASLSKNYPDLSIKELISIAEMLDIEETHIVSLQQLLIKRRRLIKNCQNKYDAILKIIKENKNTLKNCLIYCEDYKQLDKIKKLLLNEGFAVGEYTARLSNEEREEVFNAMRRGHIQFLLSCKSLDEGVDIPICDSAILMANSTVEREFIQRRGRLLRLHPDKEYAIIFDLIVLPYKHKRDMIPLNKIEKTIINSELERVKFFADNALNREEIIKKVNVIYKLFI